ncbi:MAG: Y1 Tnp protein [Magnetococcales bacterium]|nr:Y1 Tnp protein [Magnetococcales bacterium]
MRDWQSQAHVRWYCRLGLILRGLCQFQGVELIEGHPMPDPIYPLVECTTEIQRCKHCWDVERPISDQNPSGIFGCHHSVPPFFSKVEIIAGVRGGDHSPPRRGLWQCPKVHFLTSRTKNLFIYEGLGAKPPRFWFLPEGHDVR